MSENKKTLVLGASSNPTRYSYLAIKQLLNNGHTVIAIGKKKSTIENITIQTDLIPIENINTVTLYLRATLQTEFYDYILSLKPKRIIFNPGAENPAFFDLAMQNNIQAIEACTLVMLSTHQY